MFRRFVKSLESLLFETHKHLSLLMIDSSHLTTNMRRYTLSCRFVCLWFVRIYIYGCISHLYVFPAHSSSPSLHSDTPSSMSSSQTSPIESLFFSLIQREKRLSNLSFRASRMHSCPQMNRTTLYPCFTTRLRQTTTTKAHRRRITRSLSCRAPLL